jgi:RES domain-containing protein
MAKLDDDDVLIDKRICHSCIGEQFLAAEIKALGAVGACAYCGKIGPSLTVEELADRIETAFADHYTRTAEEPDSMEERMLADPESHYTWTRDGSPVIEAIQEAAMIDEEPAADVLEILQNRHGDFDAAAAGEESEFDGDAHYAETAADDQAWHEEWDSFEHTLKEAARFFSRVAAEHLVAVFGGVDQIKTYDDRPLVVDAGPQTALDHLFRARVFQAEEQLKEALCRPDLHLGSPPPRAARAGRMNAQGIAVFYGATNTLVAIAEVRPPVGSQVVVAKFSISRPLRLLDLTALEAAHDGGSIFDPTLKRRLERAAFLRTLGGRMARPVMPDDEAFEYLPTQAVADFLGTMNEPRLDGIIFPSAQTEEGRNVVLFHHAARVAALNLPPGTTIEANTGDWTEDGWEPRYSVSESVPAGTATVPPPRPKDPDDRFASLLLFDFPDPPAREADCRKPALQVDTRSVAVHTVNAVEVRTGRHAVDRHRHEQRAKKY